MKEELLEIINHYGIMKQLKYIHSEYFELDEAIMNYQNGNFLCGLDYEEKEGQYKDHIAEEISDVLVMLKQFQYYYGIEDKQIEEIMQYKIVRQIQRVKNDI